jgi:hypothetical protein
MADDLVIASTTDTEQEIKAALEPRDPEAEASPAAAAAEGTETPPAETPSEEATAEAAPAPAEAAKPETPPKKKSRSEERINELTREKYLAQRRADRLQAELDALKTPQPPQPPSPQPQPQAQAQTQAQAQPQPQAQPPRKPAVTDFAVYEDFVDALTQWNARQIAAQEIANLRAEDALAVVQAQHQEVLSQFEAGKQEARTRYPDFDQVMTSDVAIAMPITEPMQHIITTSPVGHDVAYYLVQHPDEAHQIAQLQPLDALRTLGRLEERVNFLQRMPPARGNGGTAPRTTAAPPPVEPVGGHATQIALSDDQLSYQDYKAKRDREEMQRRKARR